MNILKNTDWDNYYKNPSFLSKFTRKITTRKILFYLNMSFKKNEEFIVCELGGANSCFYQTIVEQFPNCKYTIIDNNDYGLSLLSCKNVENKLNLIRHNLLDDKKIKVAADFVFSVGLIEHFDIEGTKNIILQHFNICKKNGKVLITFSTNTWLYNLSSKMITVFGKWIFWDERPLSFIEVKNTIKLNAAIVHFEINWFIFLTQGIIFSNNNKS